MGVDTTDDRSLFAAMLVKSAFLVCVENTWTRHRPGRGTTQWWALLAQAPIRSRRLTGDMQLAGPPSRPTNRDEDSHRRSDGESDQPAAHPTILTVCHRPALLGSGLPLPRTRPCRSPSPPPAAEGASPGRATRPASSWSPPAATRIRSTPPTPWSSSSVCARARRWDSPGTTSTSTRVS